MNNSKRILREYLESLKEDNELDLIFPMLLMAMDFRVVSTPRSSKGQPQHGKDIVAIGKGDDGVIYRWYFELKGEAAKDINDTTFMAPDGFRESVLAAKDVNFEDSSRPKFNQLPIKIVYVHPGVLKENTRQQYEGFIQREFPNGGFERWDIERLTELFGKYLFDESLFIDEVGNKLVRKILVLLDAPGWRTHDVELLTELLLNRCNDVSTKRVHKQVFASLQLLLTMILQICEENGNLLPAKRASDVVVLKVWKWLLANNLDTKDLYLQYFIGLLNVHLRIYGRYMQKLIPQACVYKGLYRPSGGESEKVLYGVRCFDFLSDVLYYYSTLTAIDLPIAEKKQRVRLQRDHIIDLITCNSGFDLPLLDAHSIPILMTLRFMLTGYEHEEKDEEMCVLWIQRIVINLKLYYAQHHMLPELFSNTKALARSVYKKDETYEDRSSLLLLHLAEIVAWIGDENLYKMLCGLIKESGVNLQVAYPNGEDDFETALLDHRLINEVSVETNITLPDDMKVFDSTFVKRYNHIPLRTENTQFSFLKTLAHVYYKTDLFPDFINFGHLRPKKSGEDDKKG